MKFIPYKIKSEFIVESSNKDTAVNVKQVFVCDPVFNYKCNKKHCHINGGECRHTKDIEFAKRFKIND